MTKISITKNKQMSIFFICTEMKAFTHRIIKNMYSKMPHLRISINNENKILFFNQCSLNTNCHGFRC